MIEPDNKHLRTRNIGFKRVVPKEIIRNVKVEENTLFEIERRCKYKKKMNIEKILLDEFTPYIYNDINQAGVEMLVIDVDDLNTCITNLVEKLTIHDNTKK